MILWVWPAEWNLGSWKVVVTSMLVDAFLNCSSPNIYMHIFLTVFHIFVKLLFWKNLIKHEISSLMIASFMACMFDQVRGKSFYPWRFYKVVLTFESSLELRMNIYLIASLSSNSLMIVMLYMMVWTFESVGDHWNECYCGYCTYLRCCLPRVCAR